MNRFAQFLFRFQETIDADPYYEGAYESVGSGAGVAFMVEHNDRNSGAGVANNDPNSFLSSFLSTRIARLIALGNERNAVDGVESQNPELANVENLTVCQLMLRAYFGKAWLSAVGSLL